MLSGFSPSESPERLPNGQVTICRNPRLSASAAAGRIGGVRVQPGWFPVADEAARPPSVLRMFKRLSARLRSKDWNTTKELAYIYGGILAILGFLFGSLWFGHAMGWN